MGNLWATSFSCVLTKALSASMKLNTYAETLGLNENNLAVAYYNESKSILTLLNRVHNSLRNQYNFKITVIDDGSSDDSYSLIKHSVILMRKALSLSLIT